MEDANQIPRMIALTMGTAWAADWDTIHAFIRIPAGALLAAGAAGEINPTAVSATAAS